MRQTACAKVPPTLGTTVKRAASSSPTSSSAPAYSAVACPRSARGQRHGTDSAARRPRSEWAARLNFGSGPGPRTPGTGPYNATSRTGPGASGQPVRVQHVAEQLEPVDQPRAGAREVGRGVDRDDPAGAELGQLVAELVGLRRARARRRSRTASRRRPRAGRRRPPPSCGPRSARPAGRARPRRPRTRSAAASSGRRRRRGRATRAPPRAPAARRARRAARGRCARPRPARGRRRRRATSVASASVRTSPSTSPSVCGSSEITSGRGSIPSASALHVVVGDGAHGAQRLRDDQVGLQRAQRAPRRARRSRAPPRSARAPRGRSPPAPGRRRSRRA